MQYAKRVWLLVLILCLLVVHPSTAAAEDEDTLHIYFYHETTCGSCDGTTEFFDIFNTQVGDVKEDYLYEVHTVNTFKEGGTERLEEHLKTIGKTRADISLPCVIIGEEVLSGLPQIEDGIRALFLKYAKAPAATYVDLPEEEGTKETEKDVFADVEVPKDTAYLCGFVTLSCHDCERAEAYYETLPETVTVDGKEYPLVIQLFNIAEPEGIEKIRAMFSAYDVPEEDQLVPIVFYKDGYIAGAANIVEQLDAHLTNGDLLDFRYPETGSKVEPLQPKDLPGIALTGFINGFNPCSISILFLLLSLIMIDRRRILKVGFTFIAGKYVAYFLLGIGLYSLVSVLDFVWFETVQKVITVILIVAALYLAILNLMDFFAVRKQEYGKVKAQLPESFRRFNNNLVKKVLKDQNRKWLLPIIFLAAMVISAGEFLCTGQIYLGTIIYMLKRGTGSMTITIVAFLVYITAMCLPQAIMILLVRGGANVISLTEGTRKRFPIIKFVNFLVFILFAVLLYRISFM